MRLVLAIAFIASFVGAVPAAAQAPATNPIKTLTPEEVQQLNSGKPPAATPGPVQNPVQDITPGQDQPGAQPATRTQAPPQTQAPAQPPAQPKVETPAQPAVPGDDIWRAGAEINVAADNHYDVWAAGALASVRGTVGHQLHAAGAEVDVDTNTQSDAYVAGAIVTVAGNYAKNLYVAGARVSVSAHVAGVLRVGGARVLIRPQAQMRGLTQIAGADVLFAGVSHGRTEIYGDTVRVDGHVAGDLVVRARSVTIGKTAKIDGNVTFQSFNEPVIEQGAVISGRQTMTLPHPQISRLEAAQALFGLVLFSIAAGFMAGLVLLLVRRPFVERAVVALRSRPGHSFGLGVLVFILVPLIAGLLMATVVGIPLALLVLLAFPLLWLVATVIAAVTMGDFLVNRVPRPRGFFGQLWQLIVGLVVLSVIGIIPYVGFVTWLAALLIGLGASWQASRVSRPAPAVASEAAD